MVCHGEPLGLTLGINHYHKIIDTGASLRGTRSYSEFIELLHAGIVLSQISGAIFESLRPNFTTRAPELQCLAIFECRSRSAAKLQRRAAPNSLFMCSATPGLHVHKFAALNLSILIVERLQIYEEVKL